MELHKDKAYCFNPTCIKPILAFAVGVLLAPQIASSTSVALISPEPPEPQAMATTTLPQEIVTLASEYHQDPVLAQKIITCESKAYGPNAVHPNVDKYGNVWSYDWGPFQINDYWQEATMKSMGLDIHNSEDSLRYGFILMSEEGTKPWKASEYCWSK